MTADRERAQTTTGAMTKQQPIRTQQQKKLRSSCTKQQRMRHKQTRNPTQHSAKTSNKSMADVVQKGCITDPRRRRGNNDVHSESAYETFYGNCHSESHREQRVGNHSESNGPRRTATESVQRQRNTHRRTLFNVRRLLSSYTYRSS